MNRKVVKIVSIVLMVLMVVTMLSTSAFATGNLNWDSVTITASDNSGATTSVGNILGALISIIQVVGMGVAIIMLVVMAIKYISAAPSEKAEIKKSATVYIVGAIVLFAASGILGIIKNFASNVQATSTSATSVVEIVDIDNTYLG
jgi:hypothetical protein